MTKRPFSLYPFAGVHRKDRVIRKQHGFCFPLWSEVRVLALDWVANSAGRRRGSRQRTTQCKMRAMCSALTWRGLCSIRSYPCLPCGAISSSSSPPFASGQCECAGLVCFLWVAHGHSVGDWEELYVFFRLEFLLFAFLHDDLQCNCKIMVVPVFVCCYKNRSMVHSENGQK